MYSLKDSTHYTIVIDYAQYCIHHTIPIHDTYLHYTIPIDDTYIYISTYTIPIHDTYLHIL